MQSLRAEHLTLTVSAKLREIDEFVKLAATASAPAARAMIHGMDEIRSQLDQMVDHERFLQVDEEKRAEVLDRRRTWLIAAAIAIVVAFTATTLALARSEARRRRKTAEENIRLQSDLAERDRRIRHLFNSSIIGVIYWEIEGRILEANDAFLQMMGYDQEDLASGRVDRRIITRRNGTAGTPARYQA